MSTQLDHFRYGSVVLNAGSAVLSGSYFGILVLAADTTFASLTTDATGNSILQGLTLPVGLYIPVAISSIDLSAGAVMVGKTSKLS